MVFKVPIWEWGAEDAAHQLVAEPASPAPPYYEITESAALVQFSEFADALADPSTYLQFSCHGWANAAGAWGRVDLQVYNLDTSTVLFGPLGMGTGVAGATVFFGSLPTTDTRLVLRARGVSAIAVTIAIYGLVLELMQ